MRTRKFLINSLTTAFYQLALMMAGFITPRIMLMHYGSEINGLISSINQFIVYFNLVEAGLSSAAIYALYKPLSRNNHREINAIVSAAKKFYNQSGYIFVLLTLGLSIFYPFLIKTNDISTANIALLVLILGINGALEFFTLSKYRVVLAADQKTYVISLASLVHIGINTAIIVVLGSLKVNIVVVRFIALLSIFARSLILTIYTRRKYKYLDYNEKPDKESLNKRWDALYLQVLGAIHKGSPVVILTIITRNLKLVSIYTIFNMIIGAMNSILSIFISGLSASFGEVIAKNENEILKKAYGEFEFFYYGLITVVYSIAMITIMPFIRIYTNGIVDANYDIPILGVLFVINGLLYNLKTPQGMMVISAGMFKETKKQTTIQGVIAVVVGLLLTPRLGVIGVVIGSICSNLYRDLDLIFFVTREITKLSVRQTLLRVVRIAISICIVWLPFVFINFSSDNYFHWIFNSIIISIYSVFVVLSINILFEREMSKAVLQRLIRVVKK